MLIHSQDDLKICKSSLKNEEESKEPETDFDNLCFICYENIDKSQPQVTLPCQHRYHYQCILLVFKSIIQKSSYASKQCPYCRSNTLFLPLIPGIQPIKYIHQEYLPSGKSKIQYIPGKCKYILKRGPKSGYQCSNCIKTEDGYCKKHFKLLESKKKTQNETDSNPSTIISSS